MSFAKSILVPTDFSSKSEIAIRYACEIARTTQAELHFLNVIQEPYDFPSRVESVIDTRKKEHAKQLTELIDELHNVDEFRSIKMKGQVETGKVKLTISTVAKEQKHDLIAIGLGGEPDLKKAMYGSITNNLLLDSTVPVFAISKRIDYRDPKHLIFATALRKDDVKVIKQMRKFALDLGISLRIIHVIEESSEKKEITKRISSFEKKIQKKLNDKSIAIESFESQSFVEGITEFIDGNKHTILTMTRYKSKFLEWLFANSTARSVAQICEVPLLMIPID